MRSPRRKSTRFWVRAAVIAALYVVLTCLIALLVLRRPIEAKEGREDA